MKNVFFRFGLLLFIILTLSSCQLFHERANDTAHVITPLSALENTEYFQKGALEHILEGEINRRGEAVGFHYNRLPTKKGKIIEATKTPPNEFGVYEAQVVIEGVEKRSNRGMSTFFPDEWDTQKVVDKINEAYENRTLISGNTYEGLTDEGIIIRMYVNDEEKIISAFPIY